MESKVTAVLLAAGRGTRMAAATNKVYLKLVDRPLLSYSLAAFSESPTVDRIVLVVAPGEEERASALVGEIVKEIRIVCGGAQRRDSALAGVESAHEGIVLVHDTARPFPSHALIDRVITGAQTHGACVPVIPVVDTLRYCDGDGFLLSQAVERDGLMRMQTPQGFKRELILRSLRETKDTVTDDAGAVLARGIEVWSVLGEETNLKVTTEADLALAEGIAALLGTRGR